MGSDNKVDKLEEAIRRLVEKDDGDTFNKVREYLYNNPNSSVLDVAEATAIPRSRILKYLKEGKLVNNAVSIKENNELDIKSVNLTDAKPKNKSKTSFRRSGRR